MAKKVVAYRVEKGPVVAKIGFGLREERRGLVIVPLADVDTTKKAARHRRAKRVAALLPPGKALPQHLDRAARFTADVGQHPAQDGDVGLPADAVGRLPRGLLGRGEHR